MKVFPLVAVLFVCQCVAGQEQEKLRVKNGDNPCPAVDVRSDTAFLASFVKTFTPKNLIALRSFLRSDYVKEKRNRKKDFGNGNWELMDSLEKIVRVDLCKLATFSRHPIDYNTVLDKQIIIPLQQLVEENHGHCGMCFDIIGIELLLKKK